MVWYAALSDAAASTTFLAPSKLPVNFCTLSERLEAACV